VSAEPGRAALDTILSRRSIGRLGPPAPSPAELQTILTAAVSAPDHEELRPWRFVVLEGPAKDAFGDVLAEAYLARCRRDRAEPTTGQLEKERTKLGRAPVVVVVGASPRAHPKVPEVEQVAAVAAAAENALLAATALGYGSMWRTGDAAYDPAVKTALGLSEADQIVGFLYLGTAEPGRAPEAQPRQLGDVVWRWAPPGPATS